MQRRVGVAPCSWRSLRLGPLALGERISRSRWCGRRRKARRESLRCGRARRLSFVGFVFLVVQSCLTAEFEHTNMHWDMHHVKKWFQRAGGYPIWNREGIRYLITRYCLRISTVFSMGRAPTVCPLLVVVVALSMEL